MTGESDDKHQQYMQRCLDLARLGSPDVRTNPLVGCCIVYGDRIIGEGFHHKFGGPHAEVNAFKSVVEDDKHLIPDSTLYVTLEPCNHHGKTPPCTERILDEKIKHVVIGMTEINDEADGGVTVLRRSGVSVQTDILGEDARTLNRHWTNTLQQGRPFITLKWAESADGFIGKSSSQVPLSNNTTQLFTHDLRRKHNAILVGAETARVDNPSLTTRVVPGNNPLRIILSGAGDFNDNLKLFQDDQSVLITRTNTSIKNSGKLIEYIDFQSDTIDILELCQRLVSDYDIGFLLIEGGATVLQQFIDRELWDSCYRISTPHLLKEGIRAPKLSGIPSQHFQLSEDQILKYER